MAQFFKKTNISYVHKCLWTLNRANRSPTRRRLSTGSNQREGLKLIWHSQKSRVCDCSGFTSLKTSRYETVYLALVVEKLPVGTQMYDILELGF